MGAFEAALAAIGAVAGAIASVAGFGIGSALTSVLALKTGTRIAVAAVSVPHVVGTAVRFALLRGRVDRRAVRPVWHRERSRRPHRRAAPLGRLEPGAGDPL